MPSFAANLTMMYTEHAFLDRFAAAANDGFKAVEFLFPYDIRRDEIDSAADGQRPARRRCSTRRRATGREASAASPRCRAARTSSAAASRTRARIRRACSATQRCT